MDILKRFYDDVYLNTEDKRFIESQIREHLLLFENEVIIRSYVHYADLLIQQYKSSITQQNVQFFHRDDKIIKFYVRLLRFHQTYANLENYNKQPFLSIRIYFELQETNPLKNGKNLFISTVAINNVDDFNVIRTRLQKLLDFALQDRSPALRNTQRIHNKFMRVNRNLIRGRPSEILYDRITKGGQEIRLDGFSARSVIIALHNMMKTWINNENENQSKLNLTVIFIIGDTTITCKPALSSGKINHGIIEIDVPNSLNSKMKYDATLTRQLEELDTEGKLMEMILKKFSKSICPFVYIDGKSSDGLIHFLNGFSFLSQICEVARYLTLNGRIIEQEPMGIALAIAKHLKINNKNTWEELYSKTPASFSAHQKLMMYNVSKSSYVVDPEKKALGGLDPASGKSLKENISTLQNKIAELSVLYPGYLSEILSARHMRDWLSDHYGSGDESNSDDSPYSSDEDTHDEFRFKKVSKNFGQWRPKSTHRGTANPWKEFNICDVKGDGNCFFNAVVDQLNKKGKLGHTPASLRRRAIDHMLKHWDHYSGFSIHGDDHYIGQMIKEGEWADHPIIQATADMLGININIHRDDGKLTPVGTDSEVTINLGYYVDFHYVSLQNLLEEVTDWMFNLSPYD